MPMNPRESEHARSEHPPPAPEDSGPLLSGSVGVSDEPATVPPGMDWSAVAQLLAERAELRVILLSEKGDLLHVAPAAQKALGCRGDVTGENWIELQRSDEEACHARWIISKALTGATRRFDLKMAAAEGTSLVTFESYPIGHGVGRGILLFVLDVVPTAPDSTAQDFEYEVERTSAGNLRLQSLRRAGRPPIIAGGYCHQVVHDRPRPCERCPVLGLTKPGDVQASARPCGENEIELSTARLLESGRVSVSVRRVPKTVLSALLRARLDELAERARLSTRERDVLELLVDGQGFERIGEKLGIKVRTVKYHQGKLLSKLGADSRSDLMRLFF